MIALLICNLDTTLSLAMSGINLRTNILQPKRKHTQEIYIYLFLCVFSPSSIKNSYGFEVSSRQNLLFLPVSPQLNVEDNHQDRAFLPSLFFFIISGNFLEREECPGRKKVSSSEMQFDQQCKKSLTFSSHILLHEKCTQQ